MNRVCEILGIEKPVISAAMVWLTNAKMVAAVCNAGGTGVLGLNAGAKDVTPDPVETAERLRQQIRETRFLTDKPFGVNIILTPVIDPFTAETLTVFETDAPDFVLMLPIEPVNPEALAKIKSLGIKIVSRPMEPTLENMKKAAEVADILICTGNEEGGHAPNSPISLLSRFPAIRKEISIPLMAAGGIVDKASAEAVKAMGAEGVYVGSRFIVTEENPAAANVKQAIIDAKADEMVTVGAVPGLLHIVKGEFADKVTQMAAEGADRNTINGVCDFRTGMLLGESGFINVTRSVDGITSMMTCKEVVFMVYKEKMIRFIFYYSCVNS